jgi:hypothetical protein
LVLALSDPLLEWDVRVLEQAQAAQDWNLAATEEGLGLVVQGRADRKVQLEEFLACQS